MGHHQCLVLAFAFLGLGIWASGATAGASREAMSQAPMSTRHEQWMARHGRVYKDEAEKERRFQIFKVNYEYIESVNRAGNRKYKLGLNKFADMTNEEFEDSLPRLKPMRTKLTKGSFRYANLTGLPRTLDWTARGAVTPIKNQGSCGSCWAFSVVAAIESINQIKNGKLISLSEQQLLDCSLNNNNGCKGGYLSRAFQYVEDIGGITTENNYPYKGAQSACDTGKASSFAVTISGYEMVPENNESSLLQAVVNQPVSVYIDSSGPDFRYYSGGVFTGPCGNTLNHAVAIIGFGVAFDGTKYWIARNSWGVTWGESGYMRIQRDVTPKGLCGIAISPSYPTI